ncbi:MAG: MlaD family protein [Synechococcaceae cyanobacterium]|jgi:phospholipid/cholesterol/gamma-HCH transport system substrate-binding protein
MSLLSTTNGPDPLDDALEQQLDRPAQLDDVMPVRTQGSLAMLTTSLVLLGGLFVAMAWIHRSPSSPGAVQFRTTDANGLQEGMEVRLSGFRIGQVDRIQLEPDAGVRVWLRIEPSYRRFLGPRSRVRMVQDTLIGPGNLAVSPDPDALRGRPENDLQRMPLRLAYSPSTNLPALLTAVAESRLPLNRFLNSSSRLLEGGLPKVMRSTDKAMTTARDLAADLRIQADRSEAELRSTAQATRRTLATYDDLGRQGIQRLAKADADLRASGPQLLHTLRNLDAMVSRVDGLVDRLSRSWMFHLLGDPSRVPAPLGPPLKGAKAPVSGHRQAPAPTRPGSSAPPSSTLHGDP